MDIQRFSNEQIQHYRDKGFIVLENFIDPAFLRHVLDHFQHQNVVYQEAVSRYNRKGKIDWSKTRNLVDKDDVFCALATSSPIVEVLEELLSSRVLLFRDLMVCKPKQTGAHLHWHQDSEYYDIEPRNLVSAWIPFSDVGQENGCLKLIPESHKKVYPHDVYLTDRVRLPYFITRLLKRGASIAGVRGDDGSGFSVMRYIKDSLLGTFTKRLSFLGNLQELRARVGKDEYAREVDVPVSLGSVVFFHSMLLHASHPNRSDHDRYAYIVSYMEENARFTGVGELRSLVVRSGIKREYVTLKKG